MRLICCYGSNKRHMDNAVAAGFEPGCRLPDSTVYYPPVFVDQNWEAPDFEAYMDALAVWRPDMATVIDWTADVTWTEVERWAREAARYAGAVIVIPKVVGTVERIPDRIGGAQVVLGYSVPTRHGGTDVPLYEFGERPAHLLGGHPHVQMAYARRLNVVSVDCNAWLDRANNNQVWTPQMPVRAARNRWYPQLSEIGYGHIDNDTVYAASALAAQNIVAAWQQATVTAPVPLF